MQFRLFSFALIVLNCMDYSHCQTQAHRWRRNKRGKADRRSHFCAVKPYDTQTSSQNLLLLELRPKHGKVAERTVSAWDRKVDRESSSCSLLCFSTTLMQNIPVLGGGDQWGLKCTSMSALVRSAHDCNTTKSQNHQDYPQCPLHAPVTPHLSLVDTETHLHIRKASRTNPRFGFLFPSQPWQKVLTRLLQRPEAQARC
ncbi:R-spondin-2 [Clarias magur]|uniref:R-spondin-2 n=1 Tax=Clarias magur TaxID=1594786 RepID=A0A8J4UTN4_CLAMG|nr:R-spondin-2 [Clarias magur]